MAPPLRFVAFALLVMAAQVSVAAAQTAPIVRPQLAHAPEVAYPEGGEGDADVVLVLLIGVDGRVQSVDVASGAEPFASAAREAARSWRFSPATRGGEPLAVKIRFRLSFARGEPPAPTLAQEPAPATPPADAAVRPSSEEVIEVTVSGAARPSAPSVSSFNRAEIRQLPGAFGDPFRAIEVLPGVTPLVSGLPFFYVRGAPPGNVGYFVDGVRVPYLFHAGAGPSVVHPALIERVDLYAGGFPARFGRYSGGIVAAETTEPRPEWHGEGSIRLVDAGALVEGGFADGRGTVLLGGRFSYTALVISAIAPEITLDYRDYQARFTYDISARERVTLFTFGSYDFLSNTKEVTNVNTGKKQDVETVLFGSEFYRVDGRYDAKLDGGGELRAGLTWGWDHSRLAETTNSRNMLVGTRLSLSEPLLDELTLRTGLDFEIDNYSAAELPYTDPDDPNVQDFNRLFPPRADGGAAVWTDLVWNPTKRFEVTPGVRVDSYYSEGAKALTVDPRLAVVAHVRRDVRILHALGIANQPPSFIVPVPGLAVASLRGGLQRSILAASGVEVDLPYDITASITGYTGTYLKMTDALGADQSPVGRERIPRSLGASNGIEVYIRRSLTQRLGGFVSYTLSRTTRSVGSQHFVAAFDRPHVLNAAVGYRLGRGWQTGTRFSLMSGTPNAESSAHTRDPLFYRLDFRVEKRWTIAETGWVSVVVEMINATLNKETFNGEKIGPVSVPSIGVEGGF